MFRRLVFVMLFAVATALVLAVIVPRCIDAELSSEFIWYEAHRLFSSNGPICRVSLATAIGLYVTAWVFFRRKEEVPAPPKRRPRRPPPPRNIAGA